MKKYKIRIRRDYVGYYNVNANSEEKAIEKASNIMTEEMNDEVEYSEDIEIEEDL
tara:strand:+ start:1436 stop:1600 length:165 start_codon:yes stop_codon:yes gene_type:complete